MQNVTYNINFNAEIIFSPPTKLKNIRECFFLSLRIPLINASISTTTLGALYVQSDLIQYFMTISSPGLKDC